MSTQPQNKGTNRARAVALRNLLLMAGLVALGQRGTDALQIVVESTFDGNSEGWTASGATIQYRSSGGKPGGYLEVTDLPFSSYVSAPSKFLGNLCAFDGGTLSFDHLTISNELPISGNGGRVTLISPVATATTLVLTPVEGQWVSGAVSLTASAWGVAPSVWPRLLSNVTAIQVVVDPSSGGGQGMDVAGFDNFRIEGDPPPPPLPARFGAPSPSGCKARINAEGILPASGVSSLVMKVSNAAPNSTAILTFNQAENSRRIELLFYTSWIGIAERYGVTKTDLLGQAELLVASPMDPSLGGTQLDFQWLTTGVPIPFPAQSQPPRTGQPQFRRSLREFIKVKLPTPRPQLYCASDAIRVTLFCTR